MYDGYFMRANVNVYEPFFCANAYVHEYVHACMRACEFVCSCVSVGCKYY